MTRVAIKNKIYHCASAKTANIQVRQPRLRIFRCVNQDCEYSGVSSKTANIHVRQPRLRLFMCVNKDCEYSCASTKTKLIKTSLFQHYQDVIAPTSSRRHCSNLIKTLLQHYQDDIAPTSSRRHCSNLIKTSLLLTYHDVFTQTLSRRQ